MEQRRLAGVGVLAVAVVALATGVGFGRPMVVGGAEAAPVSPPPQIGDCLYSNLVGLVGVPRADGSREDYGYGRRYGPCRDPWIGEVTGVRTADDLEADPLSDQDALGPEPCTSAAAAYLGRPVPAGVSGWQPTANAGGGLDPDRRQQAIGDQWQACVLVQPPWDADGVPNDWGIDQDPPLTTERLRGRWNELGVRNRFGDCATGPQETASPVFCGLAHDSETLAWRPSGQPVDAATMLQGCSQQAALLMQRDDPTADGSLAMVTIVYGFDGKAEIITPDSPTLDTYGSATCSVRAADPARQLTSTVVGVKDAPLPIAAR